MDKELLMPYLEKASVLYEQIKRDNDLHSKLGYGSDAAAVLAIASAMYVSAQLAGQGVNPQPTTTVAPVETPQATPTTDNTQLSQISAQLKTLEERLAGLPSQPAEQKPETRQTEDIRRLPYITVKAKWTINDSDMVYEVNNIIKEIGWTPRKTYFHGSDLKPFSGQLELSAEDLGYFRSDKEQYINIFLRKGNQHLRLDVNLADSEIDFFLTLQVPTLVQGVDRIGDYFPQANDSLLSLLHQLEKNVGDPLQFEWTSDDVTEYAKADWRQVYRVEAPDEE